MRATPTSQDGHLNTTHPRYAAQTLVLSPVLLNKQGEAMVAWCNMPSPLQEPVPGIGSPPPEFDPPGRTRPSPPVPQDDPMRPLPPEQPEIPPNER